MKQTRTIKWKTILENDFTHVFKESVNRKKKCWRLFACITLTSKGTIGAQRDLMNVYFFFVHLHVTRSVAEDASPWGWSSYSHSQVISIFKYVTPFTSTYLHFPWENVCLILHSDPMVVYIAGLFVFSCFLAVIYCMGHLGLFQQSTNLYLNTLTK